MASRKILLAARFPTRPLPPPLLVTRANERASERSNRSASCSGTAIGEPQVENRSSSDFSFSEPISTARARSPFVHREAASKPGRGLSFNDRMVLRAIRGDEVRSRRPSDRPPSRNCRCYACRYRSYIIFIRRRSGT